MKSAHETGIASVVIEVKAELGSCVCGKNSCTTSTKPDHTSGEGTIDMSIVNGQMDDIENGGVDLAVMVEKSGQQIKKYGGKVEGLDRKEEPG